MKYSVPKKHGIKPPPTTPRPAVTPGGKKVIQKLDQFDVKGRGTIFIFDKTQNPRVNVGDKVQVDGKGYEIMALEFCNKLLYPPILSHEVGMVVRPL